MVIKDLLNKVSKPQDPNNPQVQQLRDKLANLQKNSSQTDKQPSSPNNTSERRSTIKTDSDIEKLTEASEQEQIEFAQQQRPTLRLQEERTQKLLAKQITEMIQLTGELNKRIHQLEQEKNAAEKKTEAIVKRNDEIAEKMKIIDQRLEKFMGLYEVVTNQYNPFAESTTSAPQMVPVKEAQVQVSDNITGAAEAVPIAQGTLSTENALKMEKLLAELEQQEREKVTATKDEVADITVKEQEVQTDVVAAMHGMLGEFEQRLKGYLDQSVQEKLHSSFTQLESVLNTEIEHAVKEEVSKLKETDDIISSALQEIEALSESATDAKAYTQEVQPIEEHILHTDDLIKAIPPSMYFRLSNGVVLKSIEDLAHHLSTIDDNTYSTHVGENHNHFADWLEALKDPRGQELRGKSKEEMISVLKA